MLVDGLLWLQGGQKSENNDNTIDPTCVQENESPEKCEIKESTDNTENTENRENTENTEKIESNGCGNTPENTDNNGLKEETQPSSIQAQS